MRTASPIMSSRMPGGNRRQIVLTVSQAIAIDEMIDTVPAAAATASPAGLQNVDGVCQSGLNGLTAGGTDGLDTVRYLSMHACTVRPCDLHRYSPCLFPLKAYTQSQVILASM